ncbi:ArsR/SmtB family transcription factor [Herbiconiux flava]|uniref:DNA-binding transcriptional ArsR family regulator n=1 Tax=Herbiconiux flava TaxID=881268 RepID=A0A852SK21_9MICO|nr:metalloregulator ArsR/SmtB family transcription factor [Herbiconiux flava]NYD69833.1 DNA-binding transcriptional ArsR family regulator [Herbiconiux flava]GLK16582.1 transcriptional regulator [Herbiconiux flava]
MVDGVPIPAEALVDALKALSNPVRLEIVGWLRDPEAAFADYDPIADRAEVGACVSHIQAKSGLAQSTVSSYMATLERAGLVHPTRVGKYTHYRLDEERMKQVGDAVTGAAGSGSI